MVLYKIVSIHLLPYRLMRSYNNFEGRWDVKIHYHLHHLLL
jgi:hypothetical protein